MPLALVTGASGFLGSHLCLALERAGWEVIALTRRPVLSRFPRIRPVNGDILSLASCSGFGAERLDAIFHFAAVVPRSSDSSSRRLMEVNAGGTAAMLDLYAQSSAEVFVYASSLSLIGFPGQLPITENHPIVPPSPYHVSKYAGEIACEECRRRTGRRVVAFRITAPYGPGMGDSVLTRFLTAAARGKPLQVYGSGARVQNFIRAENVADACLAATQKGNGIFNLGGPSGISMLDLAKLACDVTGAGHGLIRCNVRPDAQEKYRFEVDNSKFAREFALPMTDITRGMRLYHTFLQSREAYHGWRA